MTPGKHPKEHIQYSKHGESLKSAILEYNVLQASRMTCARCLRLVIRGVVILFLQTMVHKCYHLNVHKYLSFCVNKLGIRAKCVGRLIVYYGQYFFFVLILWLLTEFLVTFLCWLLNTTKFLSNLSWHSSN
jgi:hypothetical protein